MKPDDKEIREMLRNAMPPIDAEPPDLWPRMLRRLHEGPARMSLFDRILLFAVSLGLVAFPAIIPQLLYQL
ncbi:MAG TPA: hypothetical protein VMJ34_21515 [Bryobacteraceae bacterium]|nr:hypothetical protein [Bryobacteraceae bacterium]